MRWERPIAIADAAAVVGFGGVAKAVPAFETAVNAMTSVFLENRLIGGAIAVDVITGYDRVDVGRSGYCLATTRTTLYGYGSKC